MVRSIPKNKLRKFKKSRGPAKGPKTYLYDIFKVKKRNIFVKHFRKKLRRAIIQERIKNLKRLKITRFGRF